MIIPNIDQAKKNYATNSYATYIDSLSFNNALSNYIMEMSDGACETLYNPLLSVNLD